MEETHKLQLIKHILEVYMALIYYSIIYNYQPAVRKKDNVHNTSTVSGLAHINLVLFIYIYVSILYQYTTICLIFSGVS